ncbi:MAG: hypothetical protein DRR19_22390 [Candidatus Parabeggiatoa sp. nov. 1]|nr:MAG: hypothetical protein DRR19_22390 [Gammaproteobacteria bacterium]
MSKSFVRGVFWSCLFLASSAVNVVWAANDVPGASSESGTHAFWAEVALDAEAFTITRRDGKGQEVKHTLSKSGNHPPMMCLPFYGRCLGPADKECCEPMKCVFVVREGMVCVY